MQQIITIFLSVLLAVYAQQTCTAQWECASYSSDYNYVQCSSGVCKCRTELGFVGNATSSFPCSCPDVVYWGQGNPYCKKCDSPRKVIYDDTGIPRCVNLGECENTNIVHSKEEKQKDVIRALYQSLIYPSASQIVFSGQKPPGVFAPVIKGRITPVGEFSDYEGSFEYFFGLAGVGSPVLAVNFLNLTSEGNYASVRVDLLFNFTNLGVGLRNLTETGFFRFNQDQLIESYDLAILRLGDAVDLPPVAYPSQIQNVCGIHQAYCTGANQQYSSFTDCVTSLGGISFGSWNRANSNSVVCRVLHSLLVPLRPNIHCPHIGPSGGGKCVDHTYESWYDHVF